jgi:hypothetical protein
MSGALNSGGIMFDPFTLLAGLLPVAVEAGKAAVNRFLVPDTVKPKDVNEYVTLRKMDLEFFSSVSNAGGSNPTYLWVEAVVRLMRPSVALIVLLTWAAVKVGLVPGADAAAVDTFAAAIGFYLFGDRTLFYAKKAGGI